ncbi:hypothetical protein [uncultured Mucilaginibacter sp.]|uniref:hypothetical protein n=1 Tax=uncultured Mucilaginibacter sp. TaxID=797541 RepID=UPI0025D6CD93|nr:hypothetical protein [uncultured Mucilaginibacter sp.]
MKQFAIILCFLLLVSCGQYPPKIKFDRKLWDEKLDWDYPNREFMIDDLVKNHRLKGLTYKQLVDSLGEPANFGDTTNIVSYEIITDFGSDIDPVHTKTLVIQMNKDSVTTGFKIEEWNKDK